MYKGIFTDSDLLYRIDVVNSIDFYAMGFDMMRGETYARNALQWLQQERTDVLIVNVRLEDMVRLRAGGAYPQADAAGQGHFSGGFAGRRGCAGSCAVWRV